MFTTIKLKKLNGKEIDLCDDITRYFLSMKNKNFQAKWMSRFPLLDNHMKQNISFEYQDIKNGEYILYFADNIQFENSFEIETNKKCVDNVGIFIPGKTYYWKVINKLTNEESEIDSFTTLNTYPRFISSGSVFNMRDLGGWDISINKRVRYGLIYRGAQLKLDNKWEKSYMDDYSYKVFDYLKIRTEIELRGGYDHKLSQIHDDTLNIYINGIGYENILNMTDEQKEQYRKVFECFANITNYPFYFHCSWGADRTGVLAFLINGILGVSYNKLCEDYELTSFSLSGRRSRIDFPWKDMYPELESKYGKNKSLKRLLNEYLVDYVGVKQEHIDSFRKIMIENKRNNKNIHNVTYRINGKKYVESSIFDGCKISLVEPLISLSQKIDYWMLDKKKVNNNFKVHSDLCLDAKFENIEYEKFDTISLKDLGLNDSYELTSPKEYVYKPKVKNGSCVFSFDYKIEGKDNQFDDGVHVEIGKLWDYKAHVWFQNEFFQRVYTNNDESCPLTHIKKLTYGKTYRIDVGLLIIKNTNKKILFYRINNETISIVNTNVKIDVPSISLAGTKGVLYNVKKHFKI